MRHHINILAIVLSGYCGMAQTKVTEIDDHVTRIDFGNHIMNVYHNLRPSEDAFKPITQGIVLTPENRQRMVDLVKSEIEQLPSNLVTRYIVDNVFFLAITNDKCGYHTDDLIIIEARMTTFEQKRTMYHEIGHEIAKKSEGDKSFEELMSLLRTHAARSTASLSGESLYAAGYTSPYAITDPNEEFCELFADLMMPSQEQPAVLWAKQHPGSALTMKIKLVQLFFEKNSVPEFTMEYFIKNASKDKISRVSYALAGSR